jgi:hypothetical protein
VLITARKDPRLFLLREMENASSDIRGSALFTRRLHTLKGMRNELASALSLLAKTQSILRDDHLSGAEIFRKVEFHPFTALKLAPYARLHSGYACPIHFRTLCFPVPYPGLQTR